jgi:hypothetical protein
LVAEARFREAVQANNTVDFTLSPSGDTAISRAMRAGFPSSPPMGLFMNFDTLIGKDFEVGLANLKTPPKIAGNVSAWPQLRQWMAVPPLLQ